MNQTFPTCFLLFPKRAMVKTLTGIIGQKSIILWHHVLSQMMAAIEPNHLSDGLFLSFYSAHVFNDCKFTRNFSISRKNASNSNNNS